MSFKKCSKCKRVLPCCFGHFYRQNATSDGYTSWCRVCDREKSREDKRRLRAEGRVKRQSPEKEREYYKKYYYKNLESVRKVKLEAQRKRRIIPTYRLMQSVSARIKEMIKGQTGTSRHLQFTSDELVKHLERQFLEGMTWDNYGSVWHVDHIRPVSSFNVTGSDCDEFRDCWALYNLRPLWASENLSKNNKRTHLI